ncbi:hypothetical protein NDI76_10530 [Halogeometricum sp. S1BR25-6]|uniref:Uncharacterized protein n=1 Tax=Halogeometricum salsisoli TaxID=2950536 RepID=A0ABU2GEE2_9EURY|nr:hypothetical protein [Halogeometricum sp. S1BR25-6]MDS0299177.1 hypothetical protein [Halogeometricum sp. S1BR25-6]
MTTPSSHRGDASDSDPDSDSGTLPVLLAAAALVCGLLAGWALTGVGFAAVEAVLVAGVAALAVFSCLRYAVTRLSTE